MVYLFSSNYRPLYAKDVLDGCCYPEGHVMRLRYSEAYVPEAVRRAPALMLRERGLLIFADMETFQTDTSGEPATKDPKRPLPPVDFRFYPIREIDIVEVRLVCDILLVDVKLGKFVSCMVFGEKRKCMEMNKTGEDLCELIEETLVF